MPALLILVAGSVVGTMLSFLGGATSGIAFFISVASSIVTIVLNLLAIPGLFGRTKNAWNLIYISTLISTVLDILSLDILGGLIGLIISLWILFQVREFYKN